MTSSSPEAVHRVWGRQRPAGRQHRRQHSQNLRHVHAAATLACVQLPRKQPNTSVLQLNTVAAAASSGHHQTAKPTSRQAQPTRLLGQRRPHPRREAHVLVVGESEDGMAEPRVQLAAPLHNIAAGQARGPSAGEAGARGSMHGAKHAGACTQNQPLCSKALGQHPALL